MDWIRLKEDSDTRISYVYLPLCENTTRSFVPQALEFYRSQAGKHDFIRRENLKEEISQNRRCAGFASRIGKIILFEDYTTQQLVDMFVNLVNKNGMQLEPEAEAEACKAIQRAQTLEHFGNARYVRNLYENTIREHARNTVHSEDPEVLLKISVSDIPYM